MWTDISVSTYRVPPFILYRIVFQHSFLFAGRQKIRGKILWVNAKLSEIKLTGPKVLFDVGTETFWTSGRDHEFSLGHWRAVSAALLCFEEPKITCSSNFCTVFLLILWKNQWSPDHSLVLYLSDCFLAISSLRTTKQQKRSIRTLPGGGGGAFKRFILKTKLIEIPQ